MPSSRYSRDADDYYGDSRSERRRNDRRDERVREVSYSELGSIREKELESMDRVRPDQNMAVVRRSRTREDQLYDNDAGSRASRRSGRRDRNADDGEYDYRRPQYANDDDYNYRRSRRRDSAPDHGGGDRAARRSGRSERGSEANNQQRTQRQRQNQNESQDNEEDQKEGGFFERQFDRSSDGLITAAAGAALGAITARHFGGPKDFSKQADTRQGTIRKNWKMIGGAVLGAAAFNVAENKFTNYFEEQADRNEEMATGIEAAGEFMAAAGPDVL